ncbi:Mu-like prophage DNA circulation protein [Rhizobium phaseoli]|uniref:DNA circularization N-terminal domain-containing protein n=1 Tax=Rhizobium phaseoli TaxID=396 RepID=UPI0007EABDE3|nr:DNA circularization N-terminal domain-containing protein [Rhizobium phaseoli]ANM05224.1 Mu-like prophage DNA circulation protein [Rhizobium phaseoli]
MQLDSISWVLPGLLPGSFRGITFHVPDASSDVGRRVVEYLFPGVDAADYDDFGRAPGVVSFSGLIVGDDYRAQAIALQAAFETAGPATLIHPWLGPMTVIAEEPAQIYFSDRELRVLRFSATVKRIDASISAIVGGISGLSEAIGSVTAAASALAAGVSSILSATRSKAVSRSHRILTSTAAALTAPAGSARALPRIKAAIAAATPADPVALDNLVMAAAAVIGEYAETPAVSPAATSTTAEQPTSLALMDLGISFAEQLVGAVSDAPADADRALLLASSSQFLAATASQSAFADYASRQEAQAFRARATVAIDTLTDTLESFSGSAFDVQSTTLRRGARDLQAALIADINETIGRLPAVVIFRNDRPLDAWLLAQHVFGDTPQLIEAGYREIVARNKPRHPSALPAGGVEVLR